MNGFEEIFENNQKWSEKQLVQDPLFFEKLNKKHQPEYLWIGCCDSRISPEVITGLPLGKMLVHRNIANQVLSDDNNVNTILQFAISTLNIRKIIIAGHTNCGGVNTVVNGSAKGEMAKWLNSLETTWHNHKAQLEAKGDNGKCADLLSELNVKQQIANVKQRDIVQKTKAAGENISICGLIYNLKSGQLKKLTPGI